MTVAGEHTNTLQEGDFNFWDEVNRQPTTSEPVIRQADDPFLLLFTSGTVGLAKGIAVPLKALLSMMTYMRYGIGLRADDAYWNVADPGWAYGLYYAVVEPLLLGHATTLYDGPFTVESTYHMLGYRIGPFEVESCLIEHPAVAESAVVGKPDPERTELVKAFVVLHPGYQPAPELRIELEQLVKQRLSAHAYPREIELVSALPKTPSGKIQRFLLRQQETRKEKTAQGQ
jgi:acyl-coenzyme A synthetase/AMP-(fatty) acid ligase